MAQKKKKSRTAARKKTARKKTGGVKTPTEIKGLEKVREILFGQEKRTHAQSIGRLEKRVDKDLRALQTDSRRMLGEMAEQLEEAISNLAEQLAEQESKRRRDVNRLGKRITALGAAVEEKLARIGRKSTEADSELRARLQENSKELRGAFQERQRKLQASLRDQLEDLRGSKTDTATLSAMLGDFARRLSGRNGAKK